MVSPRALGETGYSMLELLVCTGIFLIMGTAALPKVVNMDRIDVEYETLRLMNTLRYLQTWSHQWDYCTYEHWVNYEGGSRPLLHCYRQRYYIYVGGYGKYRHDIVDGIRLRSNQTLYIFNARGHSTAGTIRISKNGYEERIVIDTVGRARVEKG